MKKAVIAYVPVLHAGYIEFFKKHNAPLYIIGREIIAELSKIKPYYGRDIRALPPELVKQAIEALKILPQVSIIDRGAIADLIKEKAELILPDEDISRDTISKYFPNSPVSYDTVFLRWDKKISQTEFEVPPDRKISENDLDKELMAKAEKEAEKTSDWWRQIGALIVRDGKILLSEHNRHLPRDQSPYALGDPRNNFNAGEKIEVSTVLHGEAGLIAQAARQGLSLAGASLYVTTFPCPNCAKLIVASGIKKVYYKKGYSLLDADKLFKSFGLEVILVK